MKNPTQIAVEAWTKLSQFWPLGTHTENPISDEKALAVILSAIQQATGDLTDQLAARDGVIARLREALESARVSLIDCAGQFKGHGMLASYDVAKVYERDASDRLATERKEDEAS